jgi:hypothetical protein
MTEQTRTVKTSELKVGDIVRNYGMRIRINAITEHKDEKSHGGVFWSSDGQVLNLDEVREAGIVPMSWLRTERFVDGEGWVTDRVDFWNVQGNDLATWQVEIPVETTAPVQFRSARKAAQSSFGQLHGEWLELIHEVNRLGQEDELPEPVFGEPESSGDWWAGGFVEEYADARVLFQTDESVSVISKTKRGADLIRRAAERKGWALA